MTSFNRIAALVFLIFSIFIFNLYAQQEDDPANPRTWKYFKIYARSEDDSIYITAQDDMGIDPKLESYTIVVNMMDANPQNQFVVLGDEADPSAQRFAWNQLSKKVQDGLVNWTGTNKENMNAKRLDYASVFLDVIRQIKIKEFVAPPKKRTDNQEHNCIHKSLFPAFWRRKTGDPA